MTSQKGPEVILDLKADGQFQNYFPPGASDPSSTRESGVSRPKGEFKFLILGEKELHRPLGHTEALPEGLNSRVSTTIRAPMTTTAPTSRRRRTAKKPSNSDRPSGEGAGEANEGTYANELSTMEDHIRCFNLATDNVKPSEQLFRVTDHPSLFSFPRERARRRRGRPTKAEMKARRVRNSRSTGKQGSPAEPVSEETLDDSLAAPENGAISRRDESPPRSSVDPSLLQSHGENLSMNWSFPDINASLSTSGSHITAEPSLAYNTIGVFSQATIDDGHQPIPQSSHIAAPATDSAFSETPSEGAKRALRPPPLQLDQTLPATASMLCVERRSIRSARSPDSAVYLKYLCMSPLSGSSQMRRIPAMLSPNAAQGNISLSPGSANRNNNSVFMSGPLSGIFSSFMDIKSAEDIYHTISDRMAQNHLDRRHSSRFSSGEGLPGFFREPPKEATSAEIQDSVVQEGLLSLAIEEEGQRMGIALSPILADDQLSIDKLLHNPSSPGEFSRSLIWSSPYRTLFMAERGTTMSQADLLESGSVQEMNEHYQDAEAALLDSQSVSTGFFQAPTLTAPQLVESQQSRLMISQLHAMEVKPLEIESVQASSAESWQVDQTDTDIPAPSIYALSLASKELMEPQSPDSASLVSSEKLEAELLRSLARSQMPVLDLIDDDAPESIDHANAFENGFEPLSSKHLLPFSLTQASGVNVKVPRKSYVPGSVELLQDILLAHPYRYGFVHLLADLALNRKKKQDTKYGLIWRTLRMAPGNLYNEGKPDSRKCTYKTCVYSILGFESGADLSEHLLRDHVTQKVLSCEYCMREFARGSALAKHLEHGGHNLCAYSLKVTTEQLLQEAVDNKQYILSPKQVQHVRALETLQRILDSGSEIEDAEWVDPDAHSDSTPARRNSRLSSAHLADGGDSDESESESEYGYEAEAQSNSGTESELDYESDEEFTDSELDDFEIPDIADDIRDPDWLEKRATDRAEKNGFFEVSQAELESETKAIAEDIFATYSLADLEAEGRERATTTFSDVSDDDSGSFEFPEEYLGSDTEDSDILEVGIDPYMLTDELKQSLRFEMAVSQAIATFQLTRDPRDHTAFDLLSKSSRPTVSQVNVEDCEAPWIYPSGRSHRGPYHSRSIHMRPAVNPKRRRPTEGKRMHRRLPKVKLNG